MNPVHQNKDGKWYFWDEVWAEEYGPFDTEAEANVQLNIYCTQFLGTVFGVMQNLAVKVFNNADEASAAGYSYKEKYSKAEPIGVEEAIVVRNGTVGGNSTVDFLLTDINGNKFVMMITGNLLKSLPV